MILLYAIKNINPFLMYNNWKHKNIYIKQTQNEADIIS